MLAMGRHDIISQLQESRAPSLVTVIWEDKHHHSKCPHLPSPSLTAEHNSIWCGISLWLGSVVPAVSHPKFLCIPSPLAGEVRNRKGFDSVARTAQQYQNHLYIVNSISSINLKYSPVATTVAQQTTEGSLTAAGRLCVHRSQN